MWKRVTKGYLTSLLIASFVILLTLNIVEPGAPNTLTSGHIFLFVVIFFVTTLLTLVPSVLFIMASERKAMRNPIYYVVYSSVLSIVILPVFYQQLDRQVLMEALVFLPAGIASGCTYWWFAGRKAGVKSKDLQKQIEVFD